MAHLSFSANKTLISPSNRAIVLVYRILQREMGHHKKGEVKRQRVLLQRGREMLTFMRTEHSIDCTQIQDILLH